MSLKSFRVELSGRLYGVHKFYNPIVFYCSYARPLVEAAASDVWVGEVMKGSRMIVWALTNVQRSASIARKGGWGARVRRKWDTPDHTIVGTLS